MTSAGLQVIPVPVYDVHKQEILGQKVFRRLIDIPGEIDLVDVFRRADDIPGHLLDMLAKKPKAVWFQSGIRNDEVAERLAQAGIKVVQDRCLMVDHRRFSQATSPVYRPVHTRHFGKVDHYLTDKDGSRRLATIFPPSFCSPDSNDPPLLRG